METKKLDYKELEFVGSTTTESTQREPILRFRKALYSPREHSILYSRDEVTLPLSQFNTEMKDLEGKIREIKGSWEYRNIINYDNSELNQLQQQYAQMQRIKRQIEGVKKQ